jgi:SOS-response transcriptional repressor LexA
MASRLPSAPDAGRSGMTAGLTKRQSEILAFIRERLERTGLSPSYTEMMTHLGLSSKSSIARLVRGLEERGFVRQLSTGARSIVLNDQQVVRCPHCGHVAGGPDCKRAALSESNRRATERELAGRLAAEARS